MCYDGQKFLDALKKATVGDKEISKRELAKVCGITPESLSRYTREATPDRPSRYVLQKIAKNTRATAAELMLACGYNMETPLESLGMKQRAEDNIKVLTTGLGGMVEGVKLYRSLAEFMHEYAETHSKEKIQFSIGHGEEYDGEWHQDADYFSPVKVRFGTEARNCTTWLVLYYCRTTGGKIVVTDYAIDGRSLVEAGMFSDKALENFRATNQNPEDMPYLYSIRDLTVEERILQAIFGGHEEEYVESIVGFGFPVSTIPGNFVDFVIQHAEYFDEQDEEKRLVRTLRARGWCPEAEALCAGYEDDYNGTAGYGAVIATIIRRETGMNFAWWADDQSTPPCVLLQKTDEEYNPVTLRPMVYQYAKELGIAEYGEYVTYVTNTISQINRFKTADGLDF